MKTKLTNMRIATFILASALAFFTTIGANAQAVLKKFSYDITLKGSSNLHDWTMKSSGTNLDAYFNLNAATKSVDAIQPLTFNMPVKNLKASENLMNTRAYDAMKADKYPTISFKLNSTKVSGSQINLIGQLTICGVTKDVTLTANEQKNADGSVVLSGSHKIKMSEYGIKPPTFMFGMLKVYDDLTIDYSVRL